MSKAEIPPFDFGHLAENAGTPNDNTTHWRPPLPQNPIERETNVWRVEFG